MTHDTEHRLASAKDAVRLSDSEKAFHRAELESFMDMHPARTHTAPIRSPWQFAPALRYALAAFLAVSVGGGGIAFAAEGSLPGDTLYPVKVRVTEPLSVALTLDAQERAEKRVELTDKRLKEFAIISKDSDVSEETTQLVTDLLEQHIADASSDIELLQDQGSAAEALQTNADLESTLSAHMTILEQVQNDNPEAASDIEVLSQQIEDGLQDTHETGVELEASLDATGTDAVAQQQQETTDTIESVRTEIEAARNTLEPGEQTTLEAKVTEALELSAKAEQKSAEGESADAFILLNQADQKLLEVSTLIEAELQVDIDLSAQ